MSEPDTHPLAHWQQTDGDELLYDVDGEQRRAQRQETPPRNFLEARRHVDGGYLGREWIRQQLAPEEDLP